MIAIGDAAPDFELEADDGSRFKLSAQRGKRVLLVFYPGDNTPVCTVQLTTYTEDISRFADVGAQVLALSPQSVESHEAFAADHGGFAFPLLADEEKAVGAAYGVLGPIGFYRRSVFVISPEGRVCYSHRSTAGLTFRPVSELVRAVESCAPHPS